MLRDVLDGVSVVLQPAVLASLDVLLLRDRWVYRERGERKRSQKPPSWTENESGEQGTSPFHCRNDHTTLVPSMLSRKSSKALELRWLILENVRT